MSAESGFAQCSRISNQSRRHKTEPTSSQPHSSAQTSFEWESRTFIPKEDGALYGHGEVGFQLTNRIRENEGLKKSIGESLRKLSRELEDAEITAFVEQYEDDISKERVVIEVVSEIEDIESYNSLKQKVRSIVRRAEKDDMMIYTRISKKE